MTLLLRILIKNTLLEITFSKLFYLFKLDLI